MGLFINTNVASLNAQRNLGKSSNSLARSFQRLSSGLRVNAARDDAAGLAISTRFTAQIRGLNQAVRNTNDGISLAQTVEGALQETTNILQRMRELSVQAANDTNTTADRESINLEISQLNDELNRIGNTTTFNNQRVLDGSFIQSFFQVGANARETIEVNVRDARATALGRAAIKEGDTVVTSQALTDGGVLINGITIRGTVASDDTLSTSLGTGSSIAKAAAINDSQAFTGVKARVLGNATDAGVELNGGTLDETNYISINGHILTGFVVNEDDANDELVSQVNAITQETGITASLDEDARLVLTALDGRNIEVTTAGNGGAVTGLNAGAAGSNVTLGGLELSSDEQYTVTGAQVGRVGFAGDQIVGVTTQNSVASISVLTRDEANRTIDIVDRALEQVSHDRAALGAVQNRFESTISNLSTISENLSAARSQILDSDFAVETAQLTRNQILQQAGTSVLAAANQAPQSALTLLG